MKGVTAKEKDFSRFINDMIWVKLRHKGLPYCYGFEDIAQEVMLGLWKSFGDDWVISGHKTHYYSFILAMAANQFVNANRKVFGRHQGKQAKFEYTPQDEKDEQHSFASPEFHAALMQALEREIDRSARYSEVADKLFSDPGRVYEKAEKLGLSDSRMCQIGSSVRRSVLEATDVYA